MSKTITIDGGIYLNVGKWATPDAPHYMFFSGAAKSFDEWVVVAPHQITLGLPEGFDPRFDQIKALEQAKHDLQAKFAATITEINSRISKLQAITFEAA